LTAQSSFPALGTTATVMVTSERRLDDAVAAVRQTVEAFDRACSRFREDSELSALNRAGGRRMPAGPLLLEAAAAAIRAAEVTDGDVDPSLGAALIALGYDRDFNLGLGDSGPGGGSGSVEPVMTGGRMAFASVPGWRTIRLDAGAATIAVEPGVLLDLGATAKALASDHAAAAALTAAGGGVLVSLGGDLATAGEAPAEGWRIRVTDDHRGGPEAPGQWVTITAGGLATSSTSARRWRRGGQDVHHLIDPSTGEPARSGWRTVSVAASCCLDANIASTAAVIRGERAPGWLEQLGLAARLVDDGGRVVHLGGWPAEGDDLPPATGPTARASAAEAPV
jgi:thiamine biosynthesis lipoprotein